MEIDFTVINLNNFAIISIAADVITVIRNLRPIFYNITFITTNNCNPTIYMNKVYDTIDTFRQFKKITVVL